MIFFGVALSIVVRFLGSLELSCRGARQSLSMLCIDLAVFCICELVIVMTTDMMNLFGGQGLGFDGRAYWSLATLAFVASFGPWSSGMSRGYQQCWNRLCGGRFGMRKQQRRQAPPSDLDQQADAVRVVGARASET